MCPPVKSAATVTPSGVHRCGKRTTEPSANPIVPPPTATAKRSPILIDNPGWKPRRSGRGGTPGPPDCRTRPGDWAGVPVPPVPDAGAGDGVARALRAGPVLLEPGAGAGQLLRHRRPQGLPELRRAVSATDRGPGGARLVGRRQPDRPAAGPARSRPGLAQLLRPHPPAADLAPGRPARGLPDRRRTGRPGPPAQPSLGRGRS